MKYCKRGHKQITKNIYITPDKRNNCKICRKLRMIKWCNENKWYSSYTHAKQRCNNIKNDRYKDYGGKGIKMLMTSNDFKYLWFRDKAYLMKKPSIDRINNDKHYKLNNCRFIELKENASKESKGEKNSAVKLTKNQVKKIRKLYNTNKYTYEELGNKFKVSHATIHAIVKYKTWKVPERRVKI